nr:MAG TPA: Protein of unknown function (DUF2786) [Caudoviricetes sp.]
MKLLDILFYIALAFIIVTAFFSWFGRSDREKRNKKRAERQARIYARKVYEYLKNSQNEEAYRCINEYTETEYKQEKPKEERKTFNRKKIIALLIKLRELARRGVGGEKTNAERMFYELLKKYNIQESELPK